MFPSGPTVGPASTPWPEDGSVNVHRIEPLAPIAVIVFIEATYALCDATRLAIRTITD